jgi:transketolase
MEASGKIATANSLENPVANPPEAPAGPPILIGSSGDSLREAFGKALVQLAPKYPNFVVFDADIAGGTGVHHFRKAYPGRFFQFGIAEQNMMAAAGGFASTSVTTFVTTFAVFCLRAFEQARLSVAYARRDVKIVASHTGLDTGPDGASAQCIEDLAAYRAIPGMLVLSPADPLEIEQATEAILNYNGPVYMRSGRSKTRRILDATYKFEIGKGRILRTNAAHSPTKQDDVTIVACGVEVARALDAADQLAAEGISARVVNMSTIKPIDTVLLIQCAEETGCIVTAEDHNIHGGLGSAAAEALAQHHPIPIEMIGVQDTFGESGEPDELAEKYNLTGPYIAQAARKVIQRKRRD